MPPSRVLMASCELATHDPVKRAPTGAKQEGYALDCIPADCSTRDQGHRATGLTFARTPRNDLLLKGKRSFSPCNDQLTGLLNRGGFLAAVNGALVGPRSSDLAVALVDLNDFAAFNDAFGDDKGDALLRAVAAHLVVHVADALVVARIGNDVFGVLHASQANISVDVHRAVRVACARAGPDITITCSIGIATTDNGARSGSEVLRQASIALTTSKRAGRARHAFFNSTMATLTVERVTLVQHLHNALALRQLSVVYQPQVDLNCDHAIGVEALMRWSTSDGCAISPTQFIPLAESAGLIVSFGEWILREACLELKALHRLGGTPLRMSVNVSQIQLESDGFVSSVLRIVQEAGVDPRYLELEVTESATMNNPASVFRQLSDLKRHGIAVAMDDFGTGHSSLGSLRQMPVDRLKLDRSFIQDIGTSEQGNSIVQLVINLGRSLNLEVVAEGIETRAIAQALKTMGCRVGQGFYFAAPMDSAALRTWLALRQNCVA